MLFGQLFKPVLKFKYLQIGGDIFVSRELHKFSGVLFRIFITFQALIYFRRKIKHDFITDHVGKTDRDGQ